MSTPGPQEILLDIAWARSNAVEGEDLLDLLARKQLNNRIEDAMHKKDYWERQVLACEKALSKLDKAASAVEAMKKAAPTSDRDAANGEG